MNQFVCLFLLFLSTTPYVCAQEIKGFVRNSTGGNIEYVSIGINGKNIGTVSDPDGHFALSLPDSLNHLELTFSHISYGRLSLPISTLKQQYAVDSTVKITLPESPFEMRPVVVRNKQPRMQRLHSAGIPFPNGTLGHCIPSSRTDRTNPRLKGEEFGIIFHTDRETWVKEVSFTIMKNSFDTLVFRIGIYRIEADSTFTPLMQKPCYVDIDKTNDQVDYTCDISEYNACGEGTLYMGIEIVQDSKTGCVYFPCHVKPMYFRRINHGTMSKELFSPGIKIRGIYLD